MIEGGRIGRQWLSVGRDHLAGNGVGRVRQPTLQGTLGRGQGQMLASQIVEFGLTAVRQREHVMQADAVVMLATLGPLGLVAAAVREIEEHWESFG